MNNEIVGRGDMLNRDTIEFLGKFIRDSVLLQGTAVKAVATGCITVLTHAFNAFSELMWVVVLLVLVDFILGTLRALRDADTTIKWAEALNTVVKIFVVMAGAVGVHLMAEVLQNTSGVDTHRIFEIIFLSSVGVGESASIMKHLVYHFPSFEKGSKKIQEIIQKNVSKDEDVSR